ncbi:HAD family hydrolase [Nonomuraea helvata]|uniref:HAD family hydrolase n=1 Tax=Nonomuraea helvata TaxID=37484 RepID=A0ABV5SAK6_9ACTN
MKRRMIVCDLDGTLLDSSGRVSARTRSAIRRVQEAGHLFVIATARPVRDTRKVAAALGNRSVAVCGNGSVVYDFARGEVVEYVPLVRTDVTSALLALRGRFPEVRMGAEHGLEMVLEERFDLPLTLCRHALRVRRLEETLLLQGAGKLMVQLDGVAGGYFAEVRALLPDFEVTISANLFCEVMRRGVTKARALERLALAAGFGSGDVIAFGDMPNDLPMLLWAGRAVAVANAHPDVLAAVAEVTGSNDDDGVATWLDRMAAGGPFTG